MEVVASTSSFRFNAETQARRSQLLEENHERETDDEYFDADTEEWDHSARMNLHKSQLSLSSFKSNYLTQARRSRLLQEKHEHEKDVVDFGADTEEWDHSGREKLHKSQQPLSSFKSDSVTQARRSRLLQESHEHEIDDVDFVDFDADIDESDHSARENLHKWQPSSSSSKSNSVTQARRSRLLQERHEREIDDIDFVADTEETDHSTWKNLNKPQPSFSGPTNSVDDCNKENGPSGAVLQDSSVIPKEMDSEEESANENEDTEEEFSEEEQPSTSLLSQPVVYDSDSESDGEEGSLQARRKAMKLKMKAIISMYRDKELEDRLARFKGKDVQKPRKSIAPSRKRKRGNEDSSLTFRYHGWIPVERRKSSRIGNKPPRYTLDAANDVDEIVSEPATSRSLFKYYFHQDMKLKRLARKPTTRKVEEHVIIPVEAVTKGMLANIAYAVKDKVYHQNGTTCHQCRQKTIDQKTCCRNPQCSGIFGMLCGVCLKNRYGEDAAQALLNPNWVCPFCRGRCNCSACRNKQGKRPTGILAPVALQQGFESVDHYLISLKGEGDRPEEDEIWELIRHPEALVGFSDDGRRAHSHNGSSNDLQCRSCAHTDCDDPDNLLGFSKDDTAPVMGGDKRTKVEVEGEILHPKKSK